MGPWVLINGTWYYFHIDIAEVRTAEGKLHLYVGIDCTSKFAFVQPVAKANRVTGSVEAVFVERLSDDTDVIGHQPYLDAASPCRVAQRIKIERIVANFKKMVRSRRLPSCVL